MEYRCTVVVKSNTSLQLSSTLADLSGSPMTLDIAEGLRLLERKVASVYTLMKTSVYSIVLQQGQAEGLEGSEGGEESEGHD
jgi:DASH complex subunit DAD3